MADDQQMENNENVSPSLREKGQKSKLEPMPDGEDNDPEPEPLTTKIYYYIDDQQIPFSTEIPIPPSKITLADFKKHISRRSYRYYSKMVDPALNAEVKTDIRDEHEVLKPNATTGRFELFLLSESGGAGGVSQSCASTLPIQQLQQHCRIRASMMAPNKRSSAALYYEPKAKYIDESSSPEDTNLRLFGESNFAGSLSDGDSQYTTTDFTSVSQQNHHAMPRLPFNRKWQSANKRYDSNNRPCWTREKRSRPLQHRMRRCNSTELSSTFEDTEVSMALDLITITFHLDTKRPFGMSIVTKNNRSGFAGIFVHDVNPGGLVALDGRIRPGFVILEVNDIPLDEYDSKEALNLIITAVRTATDTRGQLKLTCARSETSEPIRNVFNPVLAEPVRPIDPTAWVQHTNAARGLDQQLVNMQIQAQQLAPMASLPEPPLPPMAPMPNKSSTIPKTNLHIGTMAAQGPATAGHSGTGKPFEATGGIRMVMNPSTDITTTSEGGHSSLECSIGQIPPMRQSGSGGKPKKKAGGKGGGIIGTLRRLMCIRSGRTSKRAAKNGSGRK